MADLASTAALLLNEQQQQQQHHPYQSSNSGVDYQCKENAQLRGVTMMDDALATIETTAAMMIVPPPPALEAAQSRRVSQEDFLEQPAAPSVTTKVTTTSSSSSSCSSKNTFAAYSVYAASKQTPGTNDDGAAVVPASCSVTASTSSSTTKTMTDFAYDAHDRSLLPVAPLLRYSSSIGMGLPLPPFLNSTPSFGSLLGGHHQYPPPPQLLTAQSSSFSFAGSEARFAISGKPGVLGVNDVSEEDTAAAVSALLDLTPAATSYRPNHHPFLHDGRTPLAQLNRASSSDSRAQQKEANTSNTSSSDSHARRKETNTSSSTSRDNHAQQEEASTSNSTNSDSRAQRKGASNGNNTSASRTSTTTTTTTNNMASRPKRAAAQAPQPNNKRRSQQQQKATDDSSTRLVASLQNAARTATSLLENVPTSDKACKCKNSHCLMLYCACFQNGTLCGPDCNCKDCKNTDAFNGTNGDRSKAVIKILHRRFDAFNTVGATVRPKKKTGAGCACKKTK
jgi:Tesmin/TSO1-like CXC domain, cysteine-rich domain